MFERDLPASVALAGVTAQGPVQPIYCPRHRHLQVQGTDPPVSVNDETKTKTKTKLRTETKSRSETKSRTKTKT